MKMLLGDILIRRGRLILYFYKGMGGCIFHLRRIFGQDYSIMVF